ncbi:hypothetical protein [Salinicola rhizosphaerae]|uniref:hypothetical protein n=1 Tax=Salinicola rhizosphaerae TaxID=1443141 RepID=UPI00167BB7E6|nr:hypothetical protein [Salinicola rhizosphaerae]
MTDNYGKAAEGGGASLPRLGGRFLSRAERLAHEAATTGFVIVNRASDLFATSQYYGLYNGDIAQEICRPLC